MHRRVLLRAMTALALAVPVGGCVEPPSRRPPGGAPPTPRPATGAPGTAPASALPPLRGRPAPAEPFAVGVRDLALTRGADRPLPTTVWYPADGAPDGGTRPGAGVAPGRFPLVLLSHGLTGLPQALAPVAIRWAAAGFVVAAPAYPHTKYGAPRFDITDVANQPADASYVISELLARDGREGDPFAGHLDTVAVAAAGHSAGAYTTTQMLSTQRDPRLHSAIVIAGGLLGGAYTGPVTPVLFVHGDADPTVSYRGGRAAYGAVPWPKAFLTMLGGDHGRYMARGGAGFQQMIETTTDFLRWSLYGDSRAKARLNGDGSSTGTSRWESAGLS